MEEKTYCFNCKYFRFIDSSNGGGCKIKFNELKKITGLNESELIEFLITSKFVENCYYYPDYPYDGHINRTNELKSKFTEMFEDNPFTDKVRNPNVLITERILNENHNCPYYKASIFHSVVLMIEKLLKFF